MKFLSDGCCSECFLALVSNISSSLSKAGTHRHQPDLQEVRTDKLASFPSLVSPLSLSSPITRVSG